MKINGLLLAYTLGSLLRNGAPSRRRGIGLIRWSANWEGCHAQNRWALLF